MKWWHVALSLGVAYLLTRSSSAEGGEGGEPWTQDSGGGSVLIGTPKMTYPGAAAPTTISADLYQRLAAFFTQMYDCSKFSYDDIAEGRQKCCASGQISIVTAANGAITVYCTAVSPKVAPTVLLQYPSLAQMYAEIGYMGLPK